MRYPNFDDISVNENWTFESVRSVEQWTHGYHRYPAKFLPNVVSKIIHDFQGLKSPIADPFAGCGTTLVEAKIHGYESHGVDINPVAELITKVKTTPLNPNILSDSFRELLNYIPQYNESDYYEIKKHDRIDYWFYPGEKYKIVFLCEKINRIENEDIKNFFLVSLSHVLKNCSKWLQSSTKPQIDKNKIVADPFYAFKTHTETMMRKNEEFYNELNQEGFINTTCDIKLRDARNTGWQDNSIGTIITSPPYVTSYEYADIHQLTGYWFEYFSDLKSFRQNFIGTSYSQDRNCTIVNSKLGQKIVDDLNGKSHKIARDVAKYFIDMESVANEMFRVLVKGGKAYIVIGNTTVKNVEIKSAEVFGDLMKKAGFKINKADIIKRSIPHKLMPTIRDKNNGRFTKVSDPNSKKVYPEEYIIIARK